jgi:hypothetical protein
MSSYVLQNRHKLKKMVLVSLVCLAITGGLSYWLAKNNYPAPLGEVGFSISYFLVFISLFVLFASAISLLLISILEAVGFWHK